MAYLVTNATSNYVALSHGAALKPGETRPVHNIGSHELTLQRAGSISISREPRVDDNMDDARYVEVINDIWGPMDNLPPSGVTLVNMELTDGNVWYMVAPYIEGLRSWKIQMRREEVLVSFDYKYSADSPNYITCFPGEAVFADTQFPALFVRCPDAEGQILELEYWQVAT